MPTSTKECISPEVSFPNLSDALQELVMNVFSLKKKVCEYVFQRVPQAKEPRKVWNVQCSTVLCTHSSFVEFTMTFLSHESQCALRWHSFLYLALLVKLQPKIHVYT